MTMRPGGQIIGTRVEYWRADRRGEQPRQLGQGDGGAFAIVRRRFLDGNGKGRALGVTQRSLGDRIGKWIG